MIALTGQSGHCDRLAEYSVKMAEKLGLPEHLRVALRRGGPTFRRSSVIKVSWLSVQIEAGAIRTGQHAVFVRG
jgi:hypothetical protein